MVVRLGMGRGGWGRVLLCLCVCACPEEKTAQLLGSGLVPCLAQMPQTGRRIPEGCRVGGQGVGGLCYQKISLFPMGLSPPRFRHSQNVPK